MPPWLFLEGAAIARSVALVFAVIMAAPAARAGASATEIESNRLHTAGQRAYGSNDNDRAYELYSEAWSLHKNADLASDLAHVELRLGLFADAANHFSYALDHPTPATTDEDRRILYEGLRLATSECGTVRIGTDPVGAEIFVDGQPFGPVEVPRDIYVEAGDHKITAKLAGHEPTVINVSMGSGESQTLTIALLPRPLGQEVPAAPSAAPPDPQSAAADPSSARRARTPSYTPSLIGAATGVAALGTSIVTFVLAENEESSAADERTGRPVWHCARSSANLPECQRIASALSRAGTLRTVSLVALGVAGAAGVTAILLWPETSVGDHSSMRVLPGVLPGATGVFIDGTF